LCRVIFRESPNGVRFFEQSPIFFWAEREVSSRRFDTSRKFRDFRWQFQILHARNDAVVVIRICKVNTMYMQGMYLLACCLYYTQTHSRMFIATDVQLRVIFIMIILLMTTQYCISFRIVILCHLRLFYHYNNYNVSHWTDTFLSWYHY